MIRKYHNLKPQTNPWHREEGPHNHHETPGRQFKQSYKLCLPHQFLSHGDLGNVPYRFCFFFICFCHFPAKVAPWNTVPNKIKPEKRLISKQRSLRKLTWRILTLYLVSKSYGYWCQWWPYVLINPCLEVRFSFSWCRWLVTAVAQSGAKVANLSCVWKLPSYPSKGNRRRREHNSLTRTD